MQNVDIYGSLPNHYSGTPNDAFALGVISSEPTIGFSGGSLYFHTDADLPDAVDPTLLADEAEGLRRRPTRSRHYPPER